MKCTLNWNKREDKGWNALFSALPRSTLPQSAPYGRALERLGEGTARRAVIMIDEVAAGLVQVIERKHLGGAVHALALDRGPLWLEGFGAPAHQRIFFVTFDREFFRRPLRLRRVIPEIAANDDAALQGFRRRHDVPGYQTSMINLENNLEDLRARLRKNWRGALARAKDLTCVWDESGRDAPWLLKHYQIDRARRNYPGPSVELLRELVRGFGAENGALTGTAYLSGKSIGAILSLCHGASATYQIGWTSEEGRAHAAHHRLLWEALRVLKEKGIRNFDLGGFNEETDGIRTFKQGLGGEDLRLAGFYT